MSERTTEARWWRSQRTAPHSMTASTSVRSTPSMCWRAGGSSTRWPTTGGGSTCCGRGITGATTTGGLQMPEWAPWGGPWISIEIFLLYPFSTWKLIKYFLCAWCNNVFLSSFQAPWKGSTKIKLGIMQIFLQVSARKVMWSCSKEDRLRTECLVPQPLKSFSWSTSCLTFLCLSFLICKTWCNDTLHFLSLWGVD